jgi:phage terminase large subunit-like protein
MEIETSLSLAQQFARLSPEEQAGHYASLSDDDFRRLQHDWRFWARPNQLPPPGDWRVWLVQAGRGFGKTRCGAEWCRDLIEAGLARRVALVAPTAADARDVMVEGDSGILSVCPPWNRPHYEPSKRRLTWPCGAMATTYSADEPERLRGPQHDTAWCDELAAWRYPAAWDMLMFGLRLGDNPRACVTTTPKPTPLIKAIRSDPNTATTRGTTYDNRDNLAAALFDQIITRYEGTRFGRQELLGELLEDVPGALWTFDLIDKARIARVPDGVSLARVAVAIDPAVTSDEGSDETGIVVVGVGSDDKLYVLADRTIKASPVEWARVAVKAYREFAADRIVAETNNGGDMIEAVIRTVDPGVAYIKVTASRGKVTRAEPISALYEQGKVYHVGAFPELEAQMCEWVPGMDSPDRMDALVWAATYLTMTYSAGAF